MSDVTASIAPTDVRLWVSLDVHKFSIVAATLPPDGGKITKAGNCHARRLLVEAAWHYRHAPRRPTSGPQPDQRAWQAQVRLHYRYRHLTEHGKRPTVVNIAIARELVGFLRAAITDQPLTSARDQHQEAAA